MCTGKNALGCNMNTHKLHYQLQANVEKHLLVFYFLDSLHTAVHYIPYILLFPHFLPTLNDIAIKFDK